MAGMIRPRPARTPAQSRHRGASPAARRRRNLRDHYVPRTRWLIGKKGITFNDRGRGLCLVHGTMRYALFRQGMLSWRAPRSERSCARARARRRQT